VLSILQPDVAERDDGRPVLRWSFPGGVRAVSTAVVGGGISPCQWIVNVEVGDEYHRDPVEHLVGLAAGWDLVGPGCGLLTAAPVAHFTTGVDAGAECVTTVGLTHPTLAAAQDAVAEPWTPDTINTVCWVPAGLCDAALVNAVVTATEAKSQALSDAGVPGTGTPSDAIVVCCPDSGDEPYGGPRSLWGQRLANAVYQATFTGTSRWLAVTGK
jgi:adenosylcobinamide hydrolase